jgi:predicted  nucleic acid-binding Zn-ribbon protein
MENFQTDLDKMDLRLSEMEDKIDKLDVKLTQVVDAILGNPLTKTGGFIHDIDVLKLKIEELEKKIVEYDDFKKKIYWGGAIIVGLFIAVEYVVNIVANLKK